MIDQPVRLDTMPIESGSATAISFASTDASEIVFVDNQLPDLQSVLAGLRAGVEVVLLDSASDGLAQIAGALRGRSDIDAIHIVSHGAPGALDLGGTTLSNATLEAHADTLATIGAALATGGDILLYGCDVAAGSGGQALLGGLASLTRADVAASNDPTGAAGKGGDWTLERHTGPIEAPLCFTDAFTGQYQHVLANARPTLEYIPALMGGKEDTPGIVTFADLLAASDAQDIDGAVTAFRIVGFYSGGTQFKVGASLETAGSGINDVIIDATHNLYYTPPPNYSSGPGGGIGMIEVVAVDNLGAQSFSSATVYVNLEPVNDAPTIGYGNYVQGVAEDTVSQDHEDISGTVANQGSDIASLARNSGYQDIESSEARGIAIAGNDADPLTEGRWQYSTDGNGEFWHDVGTVSATSALLLPTGTGATYLRFVPVADFSGKPGSLTVHAVDDGVPSMQFSSWNGATELRATVDTTTDDATSAVSASGVEWQTEVYAINDLPVLTGLDEADDQTVNVSDAAVLVDKTQDIALADVDSPDFENGYIEVSISSGRRPGDLLAIRTDADVTLSAGMSFNSVVSVRGATVGMIGVGANGIGEDLAISLMSGATPDNVATLLRHITFDATESVAGERTVTMRVYDGDGGATDIASTLVSVEVAPTVSIGSDLASLRIGQSATVTFTFSQAPVGFDLADIAAVGGSLRDLVQVDGNPRLYTALFTPDDKLQGASASVSIAAGKFTNAHGTANAASTGNAPMTVDTAAPTLTIGADKTTVLAGDKVALTFTFSEAPIGFSAADIQYSGGGLTDFTATADSKVYTATFTPADGVDSVDGQVGVGAGGYTDAIGNLGIAANTVTIDGDTLAPTVTDARVDISGGTGPGGAFRIGDTVTVAWNGGAGGDGNADVASVTVDFREFGGGAAVAAQHVGGGVWTAGFIIAQGILDATGRNVAITVADAAGNIVTRGDSTGATVDNVAPVVGAGAIAIGGASGSGGTFRTGDTVTVSWTGEANTDIAGVTVDFSAFGGGAAVAATWNAGAWSATWQIAAGTLAADERHVTLTARDDAGNATARISAAAAAIDNAAPIVASIAPKGTPAANATEVEFTVTLSEDVSGVDSADFALAETGAATGRIVSVTGSGATYTVKVGDIAGNGSLRLDLKDSGTGIADLAGNAVGGGYSAGTAHAANFNGAPQIVSNDGGASAGIHIAEGIRQVTTVAATDPDHDTVSYSIGGGADAALFEIDAATGVLALRSAPSHAAPADSDHDGRYEVQVSAADGHGGIDTQDLTVTVLRDVDRDGVPDIDDTDIDGDGVDNDIEHAAPGPNGSLGDGNGDGIQDGEQLNVSSLPTVAQGSPYATLAVADGLTLTAVSASAAPASGLPRNVKLPAGVLDFTVEGVSVGGKVQVSIYVDPALQANGYYKQDHSGKWVNIARSVGTVGSGADSKTRITFELTDGGAFDSDKVANGRIVDPGGVGIASALITSNGGETAAVASTMENTRAVTTVVAASTGTVTYAIAGGADAALFQIDAQTGVLTWHQAPDYERPASAVQSNRYEVKVSATDDVGSDVQTLTVGVLNVPETPAQPSGMVDGVAVRIGTVVNGDGSTSQVVTIPVVSAGRIDQVGNNDVADIPLARGADGKAVLTAQLPAGVGLGATGYAAPKAAGSALADLVREIAAHTAGGSHDRAQLAAGGAGFLEGVAADTPLVVQALAPVVGQGANAPAAGAALVIAGSPAADGAPLAALVIDAGAMAPGLSLHLQDVAFAAIVGAARVTGSGGAQSVWGDGAAQSIVLGAGDDLVSGGGGNDSVDGGGGFDTALFSGAGRADYSLRVQDGALVVTQLHGGADGRDVVRNVEALRFTGGADTGVRGVLSRLAEAASGEQSGLLDTDRLLVALEKGATLEQVAGMLLEDSGMDRLDNAAFVDALYRNTLQRDADSGGRGFWIAALEGGVVSRAGMATMVAGSGEKLGMAHTEDLDFDQGDVAALVRMYATLFDRKADAGGLNFWIGVYEDGKSLATIADAFVASGEAQERYSALDDDAFVAQLYQSAFGRPATEDELAHWSAGLEQGVFDRGDVLLDLAGSADEIALIGSIGTSIQTA